MAASPVSSGAGNPTIERPSKGKGMALIIKRPTTDDSLPKSDDPLKPDSSIDPPAADATADSPGDPSSSSLRSSSGRASVAGPPSPWPASAPPPPSAGPFAPGEGHPVIQRRHQSDAKQMDVRGGGMNIDALQRQYDFFAESKPGFDNNRSRGYILLKNLMLEMRGEGAPAAPRQGYVHGPNGPAALVTGSSDGFVPTALRKNVGEWDDSSLESFSMCVNQLLNRLTEATIGDVLQQLTSRLNRENAKLTVVERRQRTSESFVSKAAMEANFASVYARFVRQCGDRDDKLRDNIVADAERQLECAIMNASRTPDAPQWAGYATFVGALSAIGQFNNRIALESLERLMRKTQQERQSIHVEMLKAFIEAAGPEFARGVPQEIWQILDGLVADQTIPQRFHFLLVDVAERRDEWVSGHRPVRARAVAEDGAVDRNRQVVRSAFADFCEDETAQLKLTIAPDAFLPAALILLPDQDRDPRPFVAFIGKVCSKDLRVTTKDAKGAIQEAVARWKKDRVDTDCRTIWRMLLMVAAELVLRGVLPFKELENIHNETPGVANKQWDALNDMKWYIDDWHDFAEPIELKDAPLELTEVLRLPNVVGHLRGSKSPIMSRLVAVGVVRSVVAKFRAKGAGIDKISEFAVYLASACHKQKRAFQEAVEAEITEEEFRFGPAAFIAACEKLPALN